MIPTANECEKLWEKYRVPEIKRKHLELVAKVAELLACKLMVRGSGFVVNQKLLIAAALLHDIDKAVEKLPGERHPDAAVRILKKEGMEEVANLVKSHPLHLIINPATSPKTLEEKILFFSDKMVKYEIIGVDKRFQLWNDERLSKNEQQILDLSYPRVKALEKEIFTFAGITLADVIAKIDTN
jgi:putative nucleotidyltransferase with HDIG domain